jgi:hypothetical protein
MESGRGRRLSIWRCRYIRIYAYNHAYTYNLDKVNTSRMITTPAPNPPPEYGQNTVYPPPASPPPPHTPQKTPRNRTNGKKRQTQCGTS